MSTPEDLIRRRRRKRPRRLRSVELPPDLDPATLAGLYEPSEEGYGGDGADAARMTTTMTTLLSAGEWAERPLPPMSVLATMQTGRSNGDAEAAAAGTANGPDCPPLLADFLKSIGVDASASGATPSEVGGSDGARAAGDGDGSNVAGEDAAGRTEPQSEDATKPAPPPGAVAAEVGAATSPAMPEEVEPIDDPDRSTLTAGQHQRYIQLWAELRSQSSSGGGGRMGIIGSSSGSGSGTTKSSSPQVAPPREREFRSLDKAVRQEWAAYAQAVEEFRRRNVDRFLLGFHSESGGDGDDGAESRPNSNKDTTGSSASEFVQAAAAKSKRTATQRSEGGNAKTYGRCIQEVSLQQMAAAETGPPSGRRRQRYGSRDMFDMKSYSAQIVQSTSSDGVARMDREWLDKTSLSNGAVSLRPVSSSGGNSMASSIKAISQDELAAKLAREHNVDVVMPADTFGEFLRRPGQSDSRWMVPVSRGKKDDDWVVLEEPIPRQATTREYLTRAFEDSVYGSAGRLAPSETEEESSHSPSFQFVYTVISLPQSSPQDGPCKVLVRSTNALLSDDEGQRPVHLDVHLEYFYERGVVEQCPHHRRAVWLAHKLLQSDCKVISVRVDPNIPQIVSASEKSVAHALAGSDESIVAHASRANGDGGNLLNLPDFDATAHFEAAARVIRAATTCKFSGETGGLLCLPGRGLSSTTTNAALTVSVHQEGEGESSADASASDVVVNLVNEIEQADGVFTGKDALMSCFVPWEWKSDSEISTSRIPFTFPLRSDK